MLEPGERALLPTVDVHVRFLRVPQDSRCPLRARCVWKGDAEVVLELAPGRYGLRLLRLDPWPKTPGGVPPAEYRAALVLYEQLRTTTSPE